MATRRTILDVTTAALRTEFDHVENRFYTAAELMDQPERYAKFPWWCVAISSHSARFDLSGTIEVEGRIPIVAIGYCISEGEDIQLEVADLIDRFILAIRTNAQTFDDACFSFEDIQIFPFQDENRHEVGTVVARAMAITGND